jgi:hypothetical protein
LFFSTTINMSSLLPSIAASSSKPHMPWHSEREHTCLQHLFKQQQEEGSKPAQQAGHHIVQNFPHPLLHHAAAAEEKEADVVSCLAPDEAMLTAQYMI